MDSDNSRNANAALIDYEINNRHTKEKATKLLPRLCIEEMVLFEKSNMLLPFLLTFSLNLTKAKPRRGWPE